MHLNEFKRNFKSNRNVRRGSSFRDLNDSMSSGQSLQDELGSLQAELGGFSSNDESGGDNVYQSMAEMLSKSSSIRDIGDIEERDGADDLETDSDEEDQFDAMLKKKQESIEVE